MNNWPSALDQHTTIEQLAASLHAERERAGQFLASIQSRLEHAEAALERELSHAQDTAEPDVGDDFQRRYQMALDDLRKLKAENAELQRQVSNGSGASAAIASGGRLDWEAEKRRILAALESFDEAKPVERAERVQIEAVLQTTDKAIAEKDREIRSLRAQLDDAKADLVAANVQKSSVDIDAAVEEERTLLRQLQDEWREKLRQAEVDLSRERAQLARQRAEIESRLPPPINDALPAALADMAQSDKNAKQPSRNRWLSRLGLTEADRDPGRPR